MTTIEFRHLCYIGILLSLLSSSCRRENVELIPPSDFTKDQREALGQIIKRSINSNSDTFELLPNQAPYDTSVYWFIQKLYDQATNLMRIDHQSPTDDQWSSDRNWNVHILVSDEINAFVLPGGDIYITTGFLLTLQEEYQLYYILSFEASLMNTGLLLDRLVSEVNSNKLSNIVARDLGPTNEDVTNLTRALSRLDFNTDEVYENDQYTISDICNTSQWSRLGLVPLLETSDDNMEWLIYRPSYIGRTEWLLNFHPESLDDCGTLRTNNPSGEGYKRFVLDPLN
ncbi:MAG: hypothetical protein ACI9VN_000069 [Patescibacteria group bacterium]|jgi:hypothetical protein